MKLLNFRYVYIALATVYVILCNIVFVGQDNFEQLALFTVISISACLIMRSLYGFSKLMFILFFWVYFAFVISSFIYAMIDGGQFQHYVAGYITIGFMILLGILGSGAIEIVLLFVGSISLLAGGIWLSRTQPNFDLYLTLSLLNGIVLLTLSVFRIDIFNARDIGQTRRNKLNCYTPIKGNFKNISVLWSISYIFLITLCISAILFTLLPRPMLKSTSAFLFPPIDIKIDDLSKYIEPEFEEYPSALDEDEVKKTDNIKAPEETNEVNLRWSFLSSLLDKTPRFYVNFSKFGGEGRRLQNDDFYSKIKVFDVFNGEKWLVSPYSQNAWSNTQNEDYIFPLMYEILDMRENTQGGILANAAQNGDFEANKINVQYELLDKQKYTHLFVPDFPLSLEMTNFRFNENTGEIKSNYLNPKQYLIKVFDVRYDRLMAQACSEGKGSTGRRLLDIGEFDIDLYELAVKIISDAKKDPTFMEFAGEEFSDLDSIRAVINHLKNITTPNLYRYEIAPPKVPEGKNALKFFLFDSKIGNCTQFNTAAAVLLRYLGIPTRVVAGYRGGRWIEEEKRYEVQLMRAHLWFEVYFKNFGWYRFDATPEISREIQIQSVNNNAYKIPQYKKGEITPKPKDKKPKKKNEVKKEGEKPEEFIEDTVEKEDDKDLGRFLTDYDNDAMIQHVMGFADYVFSSGWRISLLVLIVLLIPSVYFHKSIRKIVFRWLGMFHGSGGNNIFEKANKSRKSRIIENRLISDFNDLERLFRRLGYVRKRSETWQEFNLRLNSTSPIISTMLSTLILTYYYSRFGMNYNEYNDFKVQMINLKKQLQQQLKTQTQS